MHIDVSYILYHFNNKKGFLSIYVYVFFFTFGNSRIQCRILIYILYTFIYIYFIRCAPLYLKKNEERNIHV